MHDDDHSHDDSHDDSHEHGHNDSNTTAGLPAYYARRAAEYDGIYRKPERQADLRVLEAWMPAPFAGRHVLEVACGTGWWTAHGARDAASWLATDINPETLDIACRKPMPACVRFATVDAWTLPELDGLRPPTEPAGLAGPNVPPGPRFDAAFAGHWWSHVPLQRLPQWLDMLHAQLQPGALVVFLDNNFVPGSSTPLSHHDAGGNGYQLRTLADGSRHEVLKNFPSRAQAFALLGARAQQPAWLDVGHYWLLHYTVA